MQFNDFGGRGGGNRRGGGVPREYSYPSQSQTWHNHGVQNDYGGSGGGRGGFRRGGTRINAPSGPTMPREMFFPSGVFQQEQRPYGGILNEPQAQPAQVSAALPVAVSMPVLRPAATTTVGAPIVNPKIEQFFVNVKADRKPVIVGHIAQAIPEPVLVWVRGKKLIKQVQTQLRADELATCVYGEEPLKPNTHVVVMDLLAPSAPSPLECASCTTWIVCDFPSSVQEYFHLMENCPAQKVVFLHDTAGPSTSAMHVLKEHYQIVFTELTPDDSVTGNAPRRLQMEYKLPNASYGAEDLALLQMQAQIAQEAEDHAAAAAATGFAGVGNDLGAMEQSLKQLLEENKRLRMQKLAREIERIREENSQLKAETMDTHATPPFTGAPAPVAPAAGTATSFDFLQQFPLSTSAPPFPQASAKPNQRSAGSAQQGRAPAEAVPPSGASAISHSSLEQQLFQQLQLLPQQPALEQQLLQHLNHFPAPPGVPPGFLTQALELQKQAAPPSQQFPSEIASLTLPQSRQPNAASTNFESHFRANDPAVKELRPHIPGSAAKHHIPGAGAGRDPAHVPPFPQGAVWPPPPVGFADNDGNFGVHIEHGHLRGRGNPAGSGRGGRGGPHVQFNMSMNPQQPGGGYQHQHQQQQQQQTGRQGQPVLNGSWVCAKCSNVNFPTRQVCHRCGLPMPQGAHEIPLQRAHLAVQDKYKTKLCQSFSQSGHCNKGDECRFAHGEAELRAPQGLRPPANEPRLQSPNELLAAGAPPTQPRLPPSSQPDPVLTVQEATGGEPQDAQERAGANEPFVHSTPLSALQEQLAPEPQFAPEPVTTAPVTSAPVMSAPEPTTEDTAQSTAEPPAVPEAASDGFEPAPVQPTQTDEAAPQE
eukprot:TRINITY_DN3573_c4_g1_i1.p1 TRINITY_DN3573_c4_g1~~TRINITY_DN3573_c4_g1_i1.p1  ORF type:complete len:874 (-),score=134.04 TRINITY_DN3573_c4_g1_i1:456-3077(-)